MRGYLIRTSEYIRAFSAMVNGATQAFLSGENCLPCAAIVHEAASLSSRISGRTRIIFPSRTYTCTGPPLVRLVNTFSKIHLSSDNIVLLQQHVSGNARF